MGQVTWRYVVCDAPGCTVNERLDYPERDEEQDDFLPIGWASRSYRPKPRPVTAIVSGWEAPGGYVETKYYCPKHAKKA